MNDISEIRSHFDQLLDLPEPERSRALERLTEQDPSTGRAVQELLREDAVAESQFADAGADAVVDGGAEGFVTLHGVDRSDREGSQSRSAAPQAKPEANPEAHPGDGEGARKGNRDVRTGDDATIHPEGAASSGAKANLPDDSPVVDEIVLETLIGVGGLGRVYRGTDGKRVVAVKVPRPDRLDASMIRRWHEECTLAHELAVHPNVVSVHRLSTARFPDGTVVRAMVMEYLPGAVDVLTFAERNRLDRSERIALMMQACRGVHHLHASAVVHGDLKPSNLLVAETRDGPILKVGDLGGTRTVLGHDTRPPQFTWIYASPEQIEDDPAKIGPPSDVFSIGKVLYALICGVDVVRLGSGAHRRRYAEWTPPPLHELVGLRDERLEYELRRATARAPAARHENAKSLRQAIESCDPPILHRVALAIGRWLNPPPHPGRVLLGPMRRTVTAVAVALMAVILAVFACNANVRHSTSLQLVMPVSPPTDLTTVRVVRLRSQAELADLIDRHGLDEVDPARVVTLRYLWAQVLQRLAEAGARVVAFDIAFPQAGGDLDDVLVEAVKSARRLGSAVVCAIQTSHVESDARHLLPALRDEVDMIGHMWALPTVPGIGSITVVIDQEGAAPRLPLSFAAAAATETTFGRRDQLQIHVLPEEQRVAIRGPRAPGLSIPILRFLTHAPGTDDQEGGGLFIRGVDVGERLGVYPFSVPPDELFDSAEISVGDVLDADNAEALRRQVAGRVVLIANNSNPMQPDIVEYIPAENQPDGPSRSIPGVWMHAAAVESILTNMQPVRLGWSSLGMLVVACTIVVLLVWGLGNAIRAWNPINRPDRRRNQQLTRVSALWIASIVAVPAALFLIGITLKLTILYPVAVIALSTILAALLAIGLVLRAAWSHRIQLANLQSPSHHW